MMIFSVQSMFRVRECAPFTRGGLFCSEHRATGLPARFFIEFITEVAGSEEDRVRGHRSERLRDSSEAGHRQCQGASVQTRAPARGEGGREFPALGPDAQKDWSPTVFNLKVGTAKVGQSDDLKARKDV